LVGRGGPFYANIGVVPDDARIMGRRIVAINLVENPRIRLQCAEAMRKSGRNEELIAFLCTEAHGDMLSIGGGPDPQIDRHIEYRTCQHPDELCLLIRWCLEVKPPDRPHFG